MSTIAITDPNDRRRSRPIGRPRGRARQPRASHDPPVVVIAEPIAHYATNPCRCVTTSPLHAVDEDGDRVCPRCGRQLAPQSEWPAA